MSYLVRSRFEYVGGSRDGVEKYYDIVECEVIRVTKPPLVRYRVRTIETPSLSFCVLKSELYDTLEDAVKAAEEKADIYESIWHTRMNRPWRRGESEVKE